MVLKGPAIKASGAVGEVTAAQRTGFPPTVPLGILVFDAKALVTEASGGAVIVVIAALAKPQSRLETGSQLNALRTGFCPVSVESNPTAELTQLAVQLFRSARPIDTGLIPTHLCCCAVVIGTTSVETLTRVRVTVDTKDWWAVAIVPAARQSAPPLPALIALLAFSFLDTGIATPARVVTDLIIGAAPFCTASQTEAVRTTDLSRNAVVIPGTKIETEARVLISPTATAALGTVAGFIAMQNTTALRSISWHTVALIGTQLPPWTRSSARLKKADLIAPEQTTSIAQPGRTVLATLAVLTARST